MPATARSFDRIVRPLFAGFNERGEKGEGGGGKGKMRRKRTREDPKRGVAPVITLSRR